MSDNENFGFGKFIPGFDFLQNLAKGASQTLPQMPNLSNWIAPTLNPEELEKRIGELKAVHFWLDQNSRALGATIQALEVQRMTLATLKGMNFNMGELADALQLKTSDAMLGGAPIATPKDGGDKQQEAGAAAGAEAAGAATRPKARRPQAAKSAGGTAGGVVDPLQWWGALTQQFQQIAATAMKEAAAQTTNLTSSTGTAAAKAPSRKTAGATAGGARKSAKRREAGKK